MPFNADAAGHILPFAVIEGTDIESGSKSKPGPITDFSKVCQGIFKWLLIGRIAYCSISTILLITPTCH